MEISIKVDGMMCQNCVAHVTEALKNLKGVKKVKVDLQSGTAKIDSKKDLDEASLKKAIEEAGYSYSGRLR